MVLFRQDRVQSLIAEKNNKKNLIALINKVNSIEGKHTDLMIV